MADGDSAIADHERLRDLERERLRKHEKLQELLPEIASTLDVREVFGRLAAVIHDVLPHDMLSFARLTPDRMGVGMQAGVGWGEVRELPEYRFSSDAERVNHSWEHLLVYDLDYDTGDPGMARARLSPPEASEPKLV